MPQKSLDFDRGATVRRDRLALLDEVELVPPSGSGVSANILKHVLRVIDGHARDKPDCFPSEETIARIVQCSERQAKRAIRALKCLSVLAVDRRRYRRGEKASGNFYTIVWTELALIRNRQRDVVSDQRDVVSDQRDVVSDQRDVVSDQRDVVSDQRDTPSDQKDMVSPAIGSAQETPKEASKETDAEYAPEFLAWYNVYPRKVSRGHAAKAWGRAVDRITRSLGVERDAAVQWLLRTTAEFASTPKGQSGQYTPYPATWLNGERYDDDPTTWRDGSPAGAAAGPGQCYDPNRPVEAI